MDWICASLPTPPTSTAGGRKWPTAKANHTEGSCRAAHGSARRQARLVAGSPGRAEPACRLSAIAASLTGRVARLAGERITDIVNIGIGGSDLGPRMVVKALTAHSSSRTSPCISSPTSMAPTSPRCSAASNLRTTLFIVASKTFTTQETLTNARAPAPGCSPRPQRQRGRRSHSSRCRPTALAAFGIDLTPTFEFWDWVGGRFSLWSAIGPAGGHRHRLAAISANSWPVPAPWTRISVRARRANLPLTLALLSVCGTPTSSWRDAGRSCPTASRWPFASLPAATEMESQRQADRPATASRWASPPVRWSGVSRAPTASIRSSS